MLNQIEFLSQVVELSFSTWFKLLSSTSQLNSTFFQKKFNSIWYFLSWILNLNLNTRLNMISLTKWINKIYKSDIKLIVKLSFNRLIIESSFELTFWTWIEIESNCSYFQFDATQLNWELNQFNLIHQEFKHNVKRAKYRKFFDFWLLYYLFALSFNRKS